MKHGLNDTAQRLRKLTGTLARFSSSTEFRERRRALLAAVVVAAVTVAGRALLVRLLPGAELTAGAAAQELLTTLVALALLLLVAALHPLPAVLVAVAYALFFTANLEMLAAMDTFIEVQDAVFAADEIFLTGSAAGVQFMWFTAVFAVLCGLFAVAAGRAYRECVRRSHALLAAAGGALLGLAALFLIPSGLTWQEDGIVAGSVRASVARAGIGRRELAASGRSPERAPHKTAAADEDPDGELIMPRAEERRNVLLVIIEGIPGVYLDQVQAASEVQYPVVMERFSEIGERGLIATQSVAHARQTIRGLYSALTGDYPRLDLSTPKIYLYMQADSEVRLPGLPEVMNSLGYRSIYLQAADLTYMSKDRFMPEVGFEKVLGKEHFKYSHVAFNWGPDDKAYFDQVTEFIDELEAERGAHGQDGSDPGLDERPWFLTLLTVGTHHPYGVTDEYAADFPSRKIASVAYLDEALGDFFDTLEAQGHLEDTAVFIVSDESHGVTGHPFGRYWGTTVIRTPEMQRGDAIEPGSGEGGRLPIIQEELVGLRDVPISILDYLGEDDHARAFAGRSILRRYRTPRKMWFGPYVAKQSEDSSETTVFRVPDGDTLTRFLPTTGAAFAPEYRRSEDDGAEEHNLVERLRQAYIAATHIPGVEYAITAEDDEILEPDDPREQQLVLIEETAYRLAAGQSKMLTGAQYLEIPADSRARLNLELAVGSEPADNEGEPVTRPSLQALADYEEVDLELPPMPELRRGEVFELSVSFRTPEKLKRLWIDLRAQSLLDVGYSEIEVRNLSLELEPLPDEEPPPDTLDPRVRRFEVRPKGSVSAADAAGRGGSLLPVAHAGGRYAGTTYTNSIEALETHAGEFQVFEIDFEWTSDDRLVGLHDWEVIFERLYGFRPDGPLGFNEFRELESPLGVTPLDLNLLREFLHRHPRASIVTDVKTDNIRTLQEIAKRIDDHGRRIIPQVYHPNEFADAVALGYERIIWTLYRFAPNRNPDRVTAEARALAEAHGEKLLALTMPVPVVEDGTGERLAEHEIRSYAHTINCCDEYNRLRELGVDSIYTDDLAVEHCAPETAGGSERS